MISSHHPKMEESSVSDARTPQIYFTHRDQEIRESLDRVRNRLEELANRIKESNQSEHKQEHTKLEKKRDL